MPTLKFVACQGAVMQPLPAALDWTACSALFQSQIDYDSQINRLRRPLLVDETQTDVIKDLFESKVNEWKEGGKTISYKQIKVDEQLLVNRQMDRQKYGQKEFANFNIDSNFVSHPGAQLGSRQDGCEK